jgi:hypothetical protein
MSFPLWSERTTSARADGSGHTGRVMTWPLNGIVIGGMWVHAASSGV